MLGIGNTIKDLKGPILVTGASGFVGANLLKLILSYRKDVVGISRSSDNWRLDDVSSRNLANVDLNNFVSTNSYISSYNPKTIFHLAAYGAYSFESNSNLICHTNYNAGVNLVNALSKQDITAFINAGTSSEYGINCTAPKEGSPCLPDSTYASSKLAFSQYLNYRASIDQFPALNLRLYSIYGNLEDTSRLIPSIIKAGLKGEWVDLVDPQITRDFIHIDDACEAFIRAASLIHCLKFGESFNIGTGVSTSILDLTCICSEIFNYKTEPIFGTMKNRNWDRYDWFADISKAKEKLEWNPKIGLHEGIVKTSLWINNIGDSTFKSLTKTEQFKNVKISAVIACYKDEKAIPVMYNELKDVFTKLDVNYEIIFVNDSSPDNSESVIYELSKHDKSVIGITHSRNFGSQMAFKSGMEISSGDCIVLLDGDLQDPPALIPSFYNKWIEGYEVVYGIRSKRDMNPFFEFLYKSFYRLFSSLSYLDIPHDAGDFSLIDSRVVRRILECEERDLFIRGIRAYVGFNQIGVKFIRPERRFGKSTNNLWKNIEWAKKGIFSYSNRPLSVLTFIGIISLAISIFLAFTSVFVRLFFPAFVPQGFTTLILLVLIFGSLNLFAISLVGEYVLKITQEVKKRPHFIRKKIINRGIDESI